MTRRDCIRRLHSTVQHYKNQRNDNPTSEQREIATNKSYVVSEVTVSEKARLMCRMHTVGSLVTVKTIHRIGIVYN